MALQAETMAEAFRELRKRSISEKTGESPMLQIELADTLSITSSNVSRVENPRINQRPSDEVLHRVAEAFPDLTSYDELVEIRARSPEPDRTPFREREGPEATKAARQLARERCLDLEGVQGTGQGGRILKSDVEKALYHCEHEHGEGISHRAWDLAQDQGVDVAALEGSGPDGRIEVHDVRAHLGLPSRPHRRSAPRNPIDPLRETADEGDELGERDGSVHRSDTRPSPPDAPPSGTAGHLVVYCLPEMDALASSLEGSGASAGVGASVRFLAATTLALDALESALETGPSAVDRSMRRVAASALVDDLWRLASRHGRDTPLDLEGAGAAEQTELARRIESAPSRRRVWRRLRSDLPAILFPAAGDEDDRDDLGSALLRALATDLPA